jgi:hypothetical protein
MATKLPLSDAYQAATLLSKLLAVEVAVASSFIASVVFLCCPCAVCKAICMISSTYHMLLVNSADPAAQLQGVELPS